MTRRPLAAERAPWLRGTLHLPGDETVASLALCCAAVARGTTMLEGAPRSQGVSALIDALMALGVRIVREGERLYVTGMGAGGLLEPMVPLDLRGLDLQSALMTGLCGIYDFPTTILGDEAGRRRASQLLSLLAAYDIAGEADPGGRLGVALRGPKLGMPVELDLPPDMPELKAALLLAALGAPGRSRFVVPGGGWDHAERMLTEFGAGIAVTDADGARRIAIAGLTDLKAQQVAVPADPLLAAMGAVAASIVPASDIRIENVLVNPTRTAALSALVAMGAQIGAHELRTVHGEEVADLSVRHGGMKGVALSAHHVGRVMDELPLLAVAAAFAEGDTVLHLPRHLPMLDRARLADLGRGLARCGVAAEAEEETFTVRGGTVPAGGAEVATDDDPVMALAFLVLGMGANEQVTIADQSVIEERFPGLVERLEHIGASFIRDA